MSNIEVGKTYQTRDGKTVRILATDLKHGYPNVYSVVGARLREDGIEVVELFTANGNYYRHIEKHNLDLIIPPERESHWINWYGSNPQGYLTRGLADKYAADNRTQVLEIITEDGEPVDIKIHKVER